MYLYDKSNNNIDVYTMISNSKKVKEFKKREMAQKLPFEILKAATNNEKKLQIPKDSFSWDELNEVETGFYGGRFWHKISNYELTEEEMKRQLKLLNDYYQGNFTNKKVALIKKDLKTIKYFLLTQDSYQASNNIYIMNNIISIPKSLYLLQLLEQGNLYEVENEDISEQLQTFDISKEPIESFSIDMLKKMYDLQLLPGCFEGIMLNIETTQKILSKTK